MTTIKTLYRIIMGIVVNPLSRGKLLFFLKRFFTWQLVSRIYTEGIIFPWIDSSVLIIKRGETGLTGNIYFGLQEYHEMGFLLHYLDERDIFFDVGANSGSYSVLASKVKGCKVHAFEPNRSAFKRLQKNVAINDIDHLVTAENVALGSEAKNVLFTTHLDTVNHVTINANCDQVTSVNQVCLDSFAELFPSVIKIDVEGYELSVLEGATALLNSDVLQCVILEINGSGLRYNVDDAAVFNFLSCRGFSAFRYEPSERSLVRIEYPEYNGNYIFLRDIQKVAEKVKRITCHKVANVTV
jgi:FkbM family methyltransferase